MKSFPFQTIQAYSAWKQGQVAAEEERIDREYRRGRRFFAGLLIACALVFCLDLHREGLFDRAYHLIVPAKIEIDEHALATGIRRYPLLDVSRGGTGIDRPEVVGYTCTSTTAATSLPFSATWNIN